MDNWIKKTIHCIGKDWVFCKIEFRGNTFFGRGLCSREVAETMALSRLDVWLEKENN